MSFKIVNIVCLIQLQSKKYSICRQYRHVPDLRQDVLEPPEGLHVIVEVRGTLVVAVDELGVEACTRKNWFFRHATFY